MSLPSLVGRVPRLALVLIVPVVAFLVTLGISLGTSGSSKNEETTAKPTVLAISNLDVSPTASAPTATPPANRANCSAISGTAYLSDDERDWFLGNCGPAAGATPGGSAGASQSPSGPAAVGASEYALGDRLIIPSIGVNTTVNGSTVGADGQMGTPVGYFKSLWYDFKSFPVVGGYVDSGNLVLAGHVDCARCVNGGPGGAVFYNVRNLKAGDTIQYVTAAGKTVNYVVTAAEWYLPTANWTSILASSAADLSIVTCIGTFDSSRREYTHRLVLYAKKS